MTKMNKNTGAWNPHLAYLARIHKDEVLADLYYGCGLCYVKVDKRTGEVLSYRYGADEPMRDCYPGEREDGREWTWANDYTPADDGNSIEIRASIGSFEIIIEHGTGEAAMLNLLYPLWPKN